jgi:hypothetical protein
LLSYPSVNAIPSTGLEAFSLGVDVGSRREDLFFTCVAAMECWRDARGSFVAAELFCQFVAGWYQGTSTWFDRFDTEGGGL